MSKNLFTISIIFSELKLNLSFRTTLYTLIGFINDGDKAVISINTLINILNRKNLSDKLNKRRICLELDKYVSIQTERNIQLFSYITTGMELEVSFPVFDIVNEINELASQDAEFSTAPFVVLERITREIISSRMNPVVEKPKPTITAEQLVINLNATATSTIKKINKMIESQQVGRELIKDQMLNFLNDITREITTIGEPRPVIRHEPSYLTLDDLDKDELNEYTDWMKAAVKNTNNTDVSAKFDKVFGKNSMVNIQIRAVNKCFGLDPNFVPTLEQLQLVGNVQLNH